VEDLARQGDRAIQAVLLVGGHAEEEGVHREGIEAGVVAEGLDAEREVLEGPSRNKCSNTEAPAAPGRM
jgi:hypothetical protein